MVGAATELSSSTAVWLLPLPTLLSYTSSWLVLGENVGKGRRSAGMPDNDHTNKYGLGKRLSRQCATGSFDWASVPRPIRSETEYFSDMITGFVGEL
eukprot:3941299-Rhodomonas_salina.2